MKRKIGIAFLVLGISIMGIGIYSFFESYDNYLKDERAKKEEKEEIKEANENIKENSTNNYDGDYIHDGEKISIKTISSETIYVSVNEEGNEFTLNGDKFENKSVDLFIEFNNNCLTLSNDSDNTKQYCK